MHPVKSYMIVVCGSLLGVSLLNVSCKSVCEAGTGSGGGKQMEIVEAASWKIKKPSFTSRKKHSNSVVEAEAPTAREALEVTMVERPKAEKPKEATDFTTEPARKPVVKIDEGEEFVVRTAPKKEVLPMVEPVKVAIPKPFIRNGELAINVREDASKIVVVDENNANRIISAEGRDVEVNGSGGVIVISGGCGRLTLAGARNQVQCDTATEVKVTGDDNTVVMGTIGSGSISGNGNALSWGTGLRGTSPVVEASGSGNEMKRLE